MLSHTFLDSPVGRLRLVASAQGLVAVLWPDEGVRRVPLPASAESPAHPLLQHAQRELDEYFAGTRRHFTLPLDLRGTAFQVSVWQQLQTIPYGETRSYGALARQLGDKGASRAVGAANGRNPLSIVVPCHRVIGSTGTLTGFAGGMAAKRHLLELEGFLPSQQQLLALA